MARKRQPKVRRLNNGGVGRQYRTVTKRQQFDPRLDRPRTELRQVGAGEYISSVFYDRERDVITVERTNNTFNKAVDSLRVGTIESDVANVSAIPTVDSWFEVDGSFSGYMLPESFVHGDALPTLPDGLAWVRLLEGSEQVGMFGWDASIAAAEFDRTDTLVSTDAILIRSEVTSFGTDTGSPATVDLYFSQPVTLRTDLNENSLGQLFLFASNMGKLYAFDVDVTGNKVTITCDRAIDIRETVTFKLMRGVFQEASESVTTTLIGRGDRFEYVIGVNRRREGASLSVDDSVLLGNRNRHFDDEGAWFNVYDLITVGGGGAPAPARAVVLGGNANPYEGTDIDTYKADRHRPYIFPRRVSDFSDEEYALRLAWDDTDALPIDYQHGDGFIVTDDRMAVFGMGWARLCPTESLGPYSWDADVVDKFEKTDAVAGTPVIIATGVEPGALDTVRVWFNEPVTIIDSSIGNVTINTDGPALNATGTITADAFGNGIVISLDRVLTEDETVTIDFAAGIVQDDDETNQNAAVSGVAVTLRLPKYCYVKVVNYSKRPLVSGQVVNIDRTSTTIDLDEASTSDPRTVYPVYEADSLDPIIAEVVGGQPSDTQQGSEPYAILAANSVTNPADWQNYFLPTGVIDPTTIPTFQDFFGVLSIPLDNTPHLLALDDLAVDSDEPRGESHLAHNSFPGMFVMYKDRVRLLYPYMQRDGKAAPDTEYRCVWEISP